MSGGGDGASGQARTGGGSPSPRLTRSLLALLAATLAIALALLLAWMRPETPLAA